jgi:hypothetical protein
MSPSEEAEKQSPVVASSASERVASECALHCARCRCCRKSKMTISPFCPPPGAGGGGTRGYTQMQAATSGRHQGSAAASPCIQESGEGAPLGPRGAALSKWMGLWSGRSPHGYGPLQARALALVTMLRPLIRLMSDGECSTQQPPSLCAAHEVMSACDGGSSISHRHRLGAVSPTDWPTVATTTEVPTKHRSAPRLPWHCSLLKGRGTSVPLWKRHRQSEPAASMQPNCSPHGLNLSSAARLVAEGAISAV